MLSHYCGGVEQSLCVHHVAILCGVSRRTVRHWAKAGQIKAFKHLETPKIWRFRKHDVEEFFNSRTHDIPLQRVPKYCADTSVRVPRTEEATNIHSAFL